MKLDNQFIPCVIASYDELYPNGIFEFNITKMIEYIQKNPDEFTIEAVVVEDSYSGFSSINESHLDSVDIGKPVIMAEIAPERFNLIDGNHRMEKARRMGIKNVLAYKLNPAQHMKFLTTQKGYEAYIEYWNDKKVLKAR